MSREPSDFDTEPVSEQDRAAIERDEALIESHRSSADKAATARSSAPMTERDKRR